MRHAARPLRSWLIFDVRRKATMATFNIGFVSVVATFSPTAPLTERKSVCHVFEDSDDVPEDSPATIALAQRFASLCDFGLKRVVAERKAGLKTLRAEDGYGWPEHHKDWLRLGCELIVEEEELTEAVAFLSNPMNAGAFDMRLEEATREFIDSSLRRSTFAELSCSFELLQSPERA